MTIEMPPPATNLCNQPRGNSSMKPGFQACHPAVGESFL